MAEVVIHEESDAYVTVTLEREVESPPGNWVWLPEEDASQVDFEVFDPEGTSLGVKGLGDGASHVGGGKYRALYHFPSGGIYRTTVRCVGQGGTGRVTASEDLPVESL